MMTSWSCCPLREYRMRKRIGENHARTAADNTAATAKITQKAILFPPFVWE